MPRKINFNDGWMFDGAAVRLPHNAVDLPLSYFDETVYQRAFVYEKRFDLEPDWLGHEVSVLFEAAMADAKVSLNGAHVLSHADGYTPFLARLTPHLKAGENLLRVEIDGSENPAIPPFGGQIDYLTYAGIYRDVWLVLAPKLAIGLHKIETPDVLAKARTVTVAAALDNPDNLPVSGTLTARITDAAGQEVARQEVAVTEGAIDLRFADLSGIALWDIDAPHLYTLHMDLATPHGADSAQTRFGFRQATFTAGGFVLNGKPLKIRGLNRHQSFPYAGYALGRAAQEKDADILKHELRLNLVRTSHYPQSTWFLDRCDEIGLLVFEEIPGWQHIGDQAWQADSIENVRRMIRRDWNHPSIVLWGVRINESQDNHDFYSQTNAVARALDRTRQTGGVRFITDSEMLEDVYTMNDFVLGEFELGGNRGRTPLRPQAEATGLDHPVPYLITEFNGHMFPTKIHDQEQRQAEHVLRHLDVLNAMYGDPQISGAIGWCAFDYNTHKDFGSGNRICHHGVMDMFREPKFAAYAYASQDDPRHGAVLQPVTFWTRGERNIQGVLPLIILTNCDAVEVSYGTSAPVRLLPDRVSYPHLPHPPIIATVADFVGTGLGSWGAAWAGGRIDGFIDGQKVASRSFVAGPLPTTVQVAPDADAMRVGDDLRVMVRVLDQAGNKLPHLFDPVQISVTGSGHLIGPAHVPLIAGATGFWLRADRPGQVQVSVTCGAFPARKHDITVT